MVESTGLDLLSPAELAQQLRLANPYGAIYSPHCATIQPARLARGLARCVERMGVQLFERRARGVVVFMHQMGSHGPAYYRRSAPDSKHFAPECATHVTSDCEQQDLVNVYDNSIVETDAFLAQTIA